MSGVISATTAALVAVGVGADFAAIAAPILLGAATGAVSSAVTGGNPLTGALIGGIGGGFGELGGFVGDALDIGSTAGGALAGAAGGALGAGITGGNPLLGAAGGALSGGISGYFSGDTPATGSPASPDAPGISPTGDNAGVGPTTQNAAALSSTAAASPDSLSSLSSNAAPASAGLSNNGLNPNAAVDSSFLNPNGAPSITPGTAAAGNASLFNPSATSDTTNLNSTPAASSGSWNSLSDNPISNAVFGSGSSASATPTMDAKAALAAATSTGQPQIFTQNGQMGTMAPDGTTSMIGKAPTGSGALGGMAGQGLSGLLNNPAQAGLLATQLYGMSQQPALPTLAQQQAAAQGPGFQNNLPQYNVSQTRNPIANYYTYGYSPQPTQIATTLTPTAGTAAGGTPATGNAPITLAMGGMPRLPGAPHIGMPRRNNGSGAAILGAMSHARRSMGALPAAPGAANVAAPGFAHGGEVFQSDGQVQHGTGAGGQKDNVPAMLSEDEFVMPADVVSHLGDGSSNAGGGVLSQFVANVRAHKATKGMPPPAKRPEKYLPKGALR